MIEPRKHVLTAALLRPPWPLGLRGISGLNTSHSSMAGNHLQVLSEGLRLWRHTTKPGTNSFSLQRRARSLWLLVSCKPEWVCRANRDSKANLPYWLLTSSSPLDKLSSNNPPVKPRQQTVHFSEFSFFKSSYVWSAGGKSLSHSL